MNMTIFAKKRTSGDGRKFYSYLTTLTRKSTGEQITCSVKFRETCGNPEPADCPCVIEIPKGKCNMVEKDIVSSSTGELVHTSTVWVESWSMVGPFVDISMDDFE